MFGLAGDNFIALLILLLRMALFGGSQVTEADGKKIADIYWNTSNPMFHFEDSAHMFIVQLRDSVDIICPKYTTGFPEERIEYSLIYMVDRPSYETCTMMDGKAARIVGICTRPYIDQVITVVFREFTPNPNLLEFASGRDYFFISTSNGSRNGLKNEQDGLCRHYNMRLRFIIEPRTPSNADQQSHDSDGTSDEIDGSSWHDRSNSGSSDDDQQQQQDPYRGPPPVMLLPRMPPSGFGGRPVYNPAPIVVDKGGAPYMERPWWRARSFNDPGSDKHPYDGSIRNGIRSSRSTANHPSSHWWLFLLSSVLLFVFLR